MWWTGEGCLSGQGKELWEARTKKEGKEKESSKEEVQRKRRAGVGGLRSGSGGPTPRIFLCGCSFGLLAQKTEDGIQEWPPARGVETLALGPLLSRRQNRSSPVFMPGPSRTPSPGPPSGLVSPCGLRRQRCWPGEAAGRWGRAGRSPLRSEGPRAEPRGKTEADEWRCPLLGLGTTRGRRQKRVRGESPRPRRPAPPLWAANPALPTTDPRL